MDVRIPLDTIKAWSQQYDAAYDQPVIDLVPIVRSQRFLTLDQLVTVGRWKSPRIVPKLKTNPPALVEEATHIALTARSEELRIGVPILLSGVSWPVASVLLHWFHDEQYPILDVRALWSLGYDEVPQYSMGFWEEYVHRSRALTKESGTTMRALDRAFWRYSKVNQPS